MLNRSQVQCLVCAGLRRGNHVLWQFYILSKFHKIERFPPVFRKGRMKGQDGMTSNVACHATLWTQNSNEHPKTRDQQKYDIEIPQNRLV